MSTNGQEPGLSHGNRPYAAPMLGGDRAVMVPCEACGSPTIRDFFGNWICLDCIAKRQQYKVIADSGTCPKCNRSGWLAPQPSLDRQGRDEIIIYCHDCETSIFRGLVGALEGLGKVWQSEEYKEWESDMLHEYLDTWDSWDNTPPDVHAGEE